jgi:hypothetical protein
MTNILGCKPMPSARGSPMVWSNRIWIFTTTIFWRKDPTWVWKLDHPVLSLVMTVNVSPWLHVYTRKNFKSKAEEAMTDLTTKMWIKYFILPLHDSAMLLQVNKCSSYRFTESCWILLSSLHSSSYSNSDYNEPGQLLSQHSSLQPTSQIWILLIKLRMWVNVKHKNT